MKKPIKRILISIVAAPLVYAIAVLLIFDLTTPAHCWDEDNSACGRPVAFGPRPRSFFCRPNWKNVAFDGREWVFAVRIFDPVFTAWRKNNGFEQPQVMKRKKSINNQNRFHEMAFL